MEILHTIGKRIMLARLERELDQTQLGNAVHVTQKTISSWETGRSEAGTLDLTRLAEVLGKPISYFFEPFSMPSKVTRGAGAKSRPARPKADGEKRNAA